jgi:hypothetical protein
MLELIKVTGRLQTSCDPDPNCNPEEGCDPDVPCEPDNKCDPTEGWPCSPDKCIP